MRRNRFQNKSLIAVIGFSLAALFSSCNAQNANKKERKDAKPKAVKVEGRAPRIMDIVASNQEVELLADEMKFLEEPIWDERNDRLIFSEVMANKLHSWSEKNGLATYLEPSWYAGGNFLTKEGSILSCQGGARQVALIKSDKTFEVVASGFNGKKFNSPNDVVQKSDGTIWFTDPDYGLLAAYGEKAADFKELDAFHIFMYDPSTKTVSSAYAGLSKPNGLVFSRDESKLYVGNSNEGDRKLVVFEVDSDNFLSRPKTLATITSKTWGIDGLKMDENGNLYGACGDGVNIFAPDGELIGKIKTDFEVTNLCFGGENGKTLFLTGHEALYSIELLVKGK